MKSTKIVDIVKSISSKNKIKITGLRPGEKIHEILLSNEEGLRAINLKLLCYLSSNKFL